MAGPGDIGTAFLKISPDTTGLNARMAAYFKSSDWGKLGKLGGAALGAGIAAGGAAKALYEIGEQFDAVSDKIRVRTGATGKELGKLERDFKNVVKSVPADIDAAGEAIAGLNQRLGLSGKPLRAISKQMTELSRITETDVSTNVQSVARAFGDWEVKTRDQSETLDFFFKAAQSSGSEVATLAEQVVQFGAPLRQLGFGLEESTAMFALFEKAGVNTTTMVPGLKLALSSFLEEGIDPKKGLLATFEGIQDGTIKATEAIDIFGKRAGPDMVEAIQQGRFEFDDFTASLNRNKETIREAGRDTMDFSEHWMKFKNNVLVGLEPLASDVFGAVGDEMKKLTRIMSDKDLSGEEKFEAIRDRIVDLFSKLVENAAEAAPKIVGALVEGVVSAWDDMNPLAKLFTAGTLISLIGRSKIIQSGLAVGGLLGSGVATGAAAGATGGAAAKGGLAGGILSKLKTVGGRIPLIAAGAFAGNEILNGISGRIAEGSSDIFEALEAKGDVSLFDKIGNIDSKILGSGGDDWWGALPEQEAAQSLLDDMKAIQAAGEGMSFDEIGEFRKRLAAIPGISEDAKDAFSDFLQTAAHKASWKDISHNAWMIGNDLEHGWTEKMRRAADISERELENLRQLLTDKPRKGVKALNSAMEDGVDSIKDAMKEGEVSSRKGLDLINDLLLKRLALYGFEGPDASKILKATNDDGSTNPGGLQRGGMILGGTSFGDSVPAMLERKEGVLNRNAVKGLGGSSFVDWANKKWPRFQKGGNVGVPPGGFPDADGALPGMDALAYVLKQKFGLGVTDGARAAGTLTSSGNVSDHTWGGAIDVSNGITTPQMDAAHSWLQGTLGPAIKQMLYRTMVGGNHFDHIHVALQEQYARSAAAVMRLIGSGAFTGAGVGGFNLKLPRFETAFPVFGPAAAGLSKVAAGLEKEIAGRVGSAGGMLGGTHPSEGSFGKEALISLWKRVNPGVGNPNLMAAIALAESSGNPAANGPPDGRGLWQIEWPIWSSALGKFGNPFNAAANAKMAGEILKQQGLNAWVVYNTGAHQQFMQKGGMAGVETPVGSAQEAPSPPTAPPSSASERTARRRPLSPAATSAHQRSSSTSTALRLAGDRERCSSLSTMRTRFWTANGLKLTATSTRWRGIGDEAADRRRRDASDLPNNRTMPIDPDQITPGIQSIYDEVRSRLGDNWIRDTAKTLSFEVTEEGDIVMHTGANYSLTRGKDEMEGNDPRHRAPRMRRTFDTDR